MQTRFLQITYAAILMSAQAEAQWKLTTCPPGGGTTAFSFGNSMIYASNHGGGIHASPDNGKTWTTKNKLLQNLHIIRK